MEALKASLASPKGRTSSSKPAAVAKMPIKAEAKRKPAKAAPRAKVAAKARR